MQLTELVNYFRSGGSFEEFCQSQSLDHESEVIEIYMEKPFNFENDIFFFEIETTEGQVEFIHNEIQYFNLFDFYYFLEAIEESNSPDNQSLSNEIVASRLYKYAIADA
jgi:hypothetical protein